MKQAISFFILITTTLLCSAQTGFIKQWDYRYGSVSREPGVNALLQTADGGYLIGSATDAQLGGDVSEASFGNFDFWVIKLDSLGHKQWDKRFGGTDNDFLIDMIKTPDGGYVLGGNSYSGINGNKSEASRGQLDYWIVKIDSIGNKQWDKTLGGIGNDYFSSLLGTNDGGYIIGGISFSPLGADKSQENWNTNLGLYDSWIVKIDSLGSKQWDKVYGGYGSDGICPLLYNPNGTCILGGSSTSDTGGNKTEDGFGSLDYWLVKIDSLGNILWDKTIGGFGSDALASIVNAGNGRYLLGGVSSSDIGGNKSQNTIGVDSYWIVMTDSVGNVLWDKTYDDPEDDLLQKTVQTIDGGYLLSGKSTSDIAGIDKTENNMGSIQVWMVKVDSLGNKEWDKTIFTNGPSAGFGIQSRDGCYVAVASTSAGTGGYKTQPNWDITNQTDDIWIMKFCMAPVGIHEVTHQAQVNVYPNPFVNDVSITLQKEHPQQAIFTINNAIGQVIYHRTETNISSTYTKNLDLSNLPNGLYFIEVDVDGEKIVKQVVKE